MKEQQTLFNMLIQKTVEDDYLYELLEKIQINYGLSLFGIEEKHLSEKEFFDILRFSDILSRSTKAQDKNTSLKIISTLFDEYNEDATYQLFAKNVLTKLGIFPSLKLLDSDIANSDEIEIEKIFKEVFQKTSSENIYFTDSQYATFKELKNANHYSFSAGTSFGKSFMFTEYIKWLIEEKSASENIAFLVPTRALISQVVSDLTKSIKNSRYKIVSSPDVPTIFKNKKFIFVFTPERMISYFSKENLPNISTMIIDEAQNVVSDDERSPLFYHAISLAKQKSINLYFAAPNVGNPELLLELFGNSTEKSQKILDVNVIQNKYLVDFTTGSVKFQVDFLKEHKEKTIRLQLETPEKFIIRMTKEDQSIIYCNSIVNTVNKSRNTVDLLPTVKNNELDELKAHIKSTLHTHYYLADFLDKGVAFHFGALPQETRGKIEEQFRKGNIKYLFTTSTLLQGVNLPAKNLFMLSDTIGTGKMEALDFRNLAGRAGRLTKELFGNIFVVKGSVNVWQEKTEALLKSNDLPQISSKIITGEKNFYKNVGNVLTDKAMTNKSLPKTQQKQISEYATIYAFHQKQNMTSKLVNNFVQRNTEAANINKVISEYGIPVDVLMQATIIKPKYQECILQEKSDAFIFEPKFDYEHCLKILKLLYDKYNWCNEEDKRELGKESKLEYYSVLMTSWITSLPLNLIIKKTIDYMTKSKFNILINHNPENSQIFNPENTIHINQVINDLLKDIETILRFKVKNHIINYLKLTNQEDGDWQNYLEFGTNNKLVIELQKIGFDRQSALEIKNVYPHIFTLNSDEEIVEYNQDKMVTAALSKETLVQAEALLFS